MDKHIPSHLIPFLEEYERQRISEIEEADPIKESHYPKKDSKKE